MSTLPDLPRLAVPRFAPGSPIILNLINPSEKYWGILGEIGVAGVVLRGIGVNSFDDWMAQAMLDEEPSLDLATMFFPLFRIERMFLDEPVGTVESYSQRFARRVGRTVGEYLAERAGYLSGAAGGEGGDDEGEVPS